MLNYLILYDFVIYFCIKYGDDSKVVYYVVLFLNVYISLGWFGCRFKEEYGIKCFICKIKSISDKCIYILNINFIDLIFFLEYYL